MRTNRNIGPCGKEYQYMSNRCDDCGKSSECERTFMTLKDWINEEIERRFPTSILETLERNRPNIEQQPKRMATEIKGITFRDLKDCFIRALYDSNPDQNYPKSVYDIDLNKVDIMAVEQNMSCWIEKYMGIYPNVKDKIKIEMINLEELFSDSNPQ